MERNKKKKHTGLIVLIILLIVLFAPPVILYSYLSVGCTNIERSADNVPVPDHKVRYRDDGSVELDLSSGDILPFLEYLDFSLKLDEAVSALPIELELKCIVPEIVKDTLRVSASAKVFGFLPLPLIVEADLACADGEGELTVTDIRVDKKIAFPIEKLPIEMPITFELDSDDLMPRLKTLTVSDGKVTIAQTLYAEYLEYYEAPYEPIAVEIAANTPDGAVEDTTVELFKAGAVEPADVCADIASSDDPEGTLRDVLALMRDTPREKFLSELKEYEKKYFFSYTLEDILLKRDEYLENECFSAVQRKYDAVLTDLMSRYASLSLILDGETFLDAVSQSPLSFETDYPESGLSDDDTRLCFMQSYAAWLGTDTLGMPNINDVPKVKKYKLKDPLQPGMYYSLCLMTRLPDGTPAVIYHTAGGIFTECGIDEDTYAENMASEGYVLFETDGLEKPDTVYLREAKRPDMRDAYYFLLPDR